MVVHLNQKPFKCRFCDMAFVVKAKTDVHERTVHFKEKRFKCRFCNKKFGRGPDRNKHEKTACKSNKSAL